MSQCDGRCPNLRACEKAPERRFGAQQSCCVAVAAVVLLLRKASGPTCAAARRQRHIMTPHLKAVLAACLCSFKVHTLTRSEASLGSFLAHVGPGCTEEQTTTLQRMRAAQAHAPPWSGVGGWPAEPYSTGRCNICPQKARLGSASLHARLTPGEAVRAVSGGGPPGGRAAGGDGGSRSARSMQHI